MTNSYYLVFPKFLLKLTVILISSSWYFKNCSRQEAECLVLADSNPEGTFMVRKSESQPNGHSLTVKDYSSNGFYVKHYKIQFDGSKYFINESYKRQSLPQLIEDYKSMNN